MAPTPWISTSLSTGESISNWVPQKWRKPEYLVFEGIETEEDAVVLFQLFVLFLFLQVLLLFLDVELVLMFLFLLSILSVGALSTHGGNVWMNINSRGSLQYEDLELLLMLLILSPSVSLGLLSTCGGNVWVIFNSQQWPIGICRFSVLRVCPCFVMKLHQ